MSTFETEQRLKDQDVMIASLRRQLREARAECVRMRKAARQDARTIEALRRINGRHVITEAEKVFGHGTERDDSATGARMGIRKGICPA